MYGPHTQDVSIEIDSSRTDIWIIFDDEERVINMIVSSQWHNCAVKKFQTQLKLIDDVQTMPVQLLWCHNGLIAT